jgi:serine/threonine protein phosphatase 1
MRTYAIGDIHGHLDLLRDAHDKIARDIWAIWWTGARTAEG